MKTSPFSFIRLVALLLAAAMVATACGGGVDSGDRLSATASEGSADGGGMADAGDASGESSSGGVDSGAERSESDGGEVAVDVVDDAAEAVDSDASGDDSADESSVGDEAAEPPAPAEVEGKTDALAEAAATEALEAEPSAEDAIDVEEPVAQPPAQAGLLTAGDVDDNLNYTFFRNWIDQVQQARAAAVPAVNLSNRIAIDVRTDIGSGVGNVAIAVSDGETEATIYTSTAGRAWLYPFHLGLQADADLTATVYAHDGAVDTSTQFTLAQLDDATLTIEVQGPSALPTGLDLALVLDTTGSMSDELSYLTVELESIVRSVEQDYGTTDMQFALIVYRDQGDDYVTQVFDFDDIGAIGDAIAEQTANGGGDFPEAMHTALDEALTELSWRDGNVARMLVLNADAPPHQQYLNDTVDTGRALAAKGVRIYPLAASGVDETAEFTMRVLGATTGGRHLFLTDDSGVGFAHAEPKVACYQVTPLRDLLIRVIASELAGERIEANQASIIRTVGSVTGGVCG